MLWLISRHRWHIVHKDWRQRGTYKQCVVISLCLIWTLDQDLTNNPEMPSDVTAHKTLWCLLNTMQGKIEWVHIVPLHIWSEMVTIKCPGTHTQHSVTDSGAAWPPDVDHCRRRLVGVLSDSQALMETLQCSQSTGIISVIKLYVQPRTTGGDNVWPHYNSHHV